MVGKFFSDCAYLLDTMLVIRIERWLYWCSVVLLDKYSWQSVIWESDLASGDHLGIRGWVFG